MKWAVTLYSFTNELMSGRWEPSDLAAEVARTTGAEGIEVDAAQHFPSFPMIDDAEADRLRDALAGAGVTPTMLGGYLDLRLDGRGPRNEDEALEVVLHQVRAAARIGCFGLRTGLGGVPIPVLERAVPELERLGVGIFAEVQSGTLPSSPALDAVRELRARTGTESVGFIFDASLIMAGLPWTWLEHLEGAGVPIDVLERVDERWRTRDPQGAAATMQEVEHLHLPSYVIRRLMMPFGRFGCTTVADWIDFIPEVRSVHLKYWDLEDREQRVSRPTRELRAALTAAGYSGFVCSEWGGHDWLEEREAPATAMTIGHRAVWNAAA